MAVVLAAIVIGASVFASSYFSIGNRTVTSTDTETTTITVSATGTQMLSCSGDQQVWNSTSNDANDVPVLLMRPDSTGFICVTYRSFWAGNASQYAQQFFVNGSFDFGLSIGKEHCAALSGSNGCITILSRSFIIGAFPSSIRPTVDTDYVTVVYAVTAGSNSTGFYDDSAPYGYCQSMPMAVGYSASQVNASDFAPPTLAPCPFLPFAPVSVSILGMNSTYVRFDSA
ncbi:MAG: hypothetical protein OK474_00340 [Thaumarchaeota archaeon]|nr:hypothetical protein [Nitrososphaerota archaeon]